MNCSRLESLKENVEHLRNMLEEIDDVSDECMSKHDRGALIDWMVELQYEDIQLSPQDSIKNLLYSGHKGYRETDDLELLENYIFDVNGVPDSDFDGYGQLKRCETVVVAKIADLILLAKKA